MSLFLVHGAEIDLHKISTNKNYFIRMAALEIVEMGHMKTSESFLFCIISIQKTKTITVLIKKMVEMKKEISPKVRHRMKSVPHPSQKYTIVL